MSEYRDYVYKSVLAPYIRQLISEKRKQGFIYNAQAYQLKRFDEYWRQRSYTETCISPEMLHEWLCCLPGEGKSSHSGRISVVKSLAVYMNTLGIRCYVPKSKNPADLRMANEYPLMFRLYYCCGMRNNEVCALTTFDVDLESGILTIRDGKNHKSRFVYMADDLRQLTGRYFNYIKQTLGYEPFWFFPGRCPSKHVSKSQIDKRFHTFWGMTVSAGHCDKRPTPYCLRHYVECFKMVSDSKSAYFSRYSPKITHHFIPLRSEFPICGSDTYLRFTLNRGIPGKT